MKIGFLDALDGALGMGVGALGRAFTNHAAQFAVGKQMADGGFRGRLGESDLYYTDFGVRVSSLLSANCEILEAAGRWMTCKQHSPTNVVDCFNLLNIGRILEASGVCLPVDAGRLIAVLQTHQLPDGGYARPGSALVSAYNTFLAALCHEILHLDFPNPDKAIAALRGLKRPDGGYSESSGEPFSQTNATAAAAACLTMCGALTGEDAASTAEFIVRMQSSEGGLIAHPSAPEADLLSTFTGMVCLFGLDGLNHMSLPAAARCIRSLLNHEGGFRASPSDSEPDIEYTYYGLGALALLRVHMLAAESEQSS